jgi:hypothetical protein
MYLNTQKIVFIPCSRDDVNVDHCSFIPKPLFIPALRVCEGGGGPPHLRLCQTPYNACAARIRECLLTVN